MEELDLQTLDTARPPRDRAIKTFPQDRQAKRDLLLARIDEIGPTSLPRRSRRCEARECFG